jgi:hypothetical protein
VRALVADELNIFEAVPLVYPAQSKLFFYCRDAVSEFVLRSGAAPLHPFRMFDYFLGDRVDRDLVRRANNSVVARADEIWVFGTEIADGVLVEIALARSTNRPVKFFTIATRAAEMVEVAESQLTFEQELVEAARGDLESLRKVVSGALPLHAILV